MILINAVKGYLTEAEINECFYIPKLILKSSTEYFKIAQEDTLWERNVFYLTKYREVFGIYETLSIGLHRKNILYTIYATSYEEGNLKQILKQVAKLNILNLLEEGIFLYWRNTKHIQVFTTYRPLDKQVYLEHHRKDNKAVIGEIVELQNPNFDIKIFYTSKSLR
jgi:hypothetical protein